jgi:PilZ domain
MQNDLAQSERRHSVRLKPRELMYLTLSSSNGSANGGMVVDLCEDGFRFEFFDPVRLSPLLNVSLSLSPTMPFQASGELVWTDPSRKTGGVRFTAIHGTARRRLRDWLDEQEWLAAQESGEVSVAAGNSTDSAAPEHPTSAPKATKSQAPSGPSTAKPKSTLSPSMYVDASSSLPFLRDQFHKVKDRSVSAIPAQQFRESAEHALLRTFESAVNAGDAASNLYHTAASPGVFREAAKIVAGLALIVALLIVAMNFNGDLGSTLIRLGEDIGGKQPASAPEPATAPAATNGASPATTVPDGSSAATTANPPASLIPPPRTPPAIAPSTTNAHSAGDPAPAPIHRSTPTVSRAQSSTSIATPVDPTAGESELDIAQGYLEGRSKAPNPAQAVPWLWTSVRKGNLTADVTLADLYIRGVGVQQNCQQGIVLLTAAAKKGDATALTKLRSLDLGPCGANAKSH